MADGESARAVDWRVLDLEGQVTAFAGLSEAIMAVDDLLGSASFELAGTGSGIAHRAMWTGRREVRAVALA
jgi:hypothetical protein